jgi:hypothetical protein
MKLDMYIMAPEPISSCTTHINPFRQSACRCVYPTTVARQELGKNVNAATNTRAVTVFLDS